MKEMWSDNKFQSIKLFLSFDHERNMIKTEKFSGFLFVCLFPFLLLFDDWFIDSDK